MGYKLERLLKRCTVKLAVPDKPGWGTGFFVAPGLILTCHHVVKYAGNNPINVCCQNQEDFAEAIIERSLPDFDLALLRFSPPVADLPCVYLDKSFQADDSLYTYGYPDNFPQGAPVTAKCEGMTENPPLIKFKAGQIRPGLSGSPLLNQRTGKICGIVKFTRDRSIDLGGGAVPTREILSQFPELVELQQKFHQQDDRWRKLLPEKTTTPQQLAQKNPDNLPRSGVRQFVGRNKALKDLNKQLQESERIAISTLTGMGGIGKTELALQYALADRDKAEEERSYQAGICWVDVSEKGNIGTQILSFAREYLEIPTSEEGSLEDRVKLSWQNWSEGDTLIIFDDVREYGQIKEFLPPQNKRFKVIITTRKQRLAESLKVFVLEVLEEQPALDLIISFIGDERVNSQLEEAKKLCKDLGYLPLALELVARFLNRRQNWSLQKMRERLEKKHLETRAMDKPSEEMTAERGVKTAIEISWEELHEEAQTVACYLSLFEVAPIPYNLIQELCPLEDEDELEEIIEDSLVNLSLLKNLGNQRYEMHTLIHQYLRDKLEESDIGINAKKTYCQLMTVITGQIPQTPTQDDIQNFTVTIPHLTVAARELNQWIAGDNIVVVYMGLESFYQGQGIYLEAEPWAKQCLSLTRERLGEDHPSVATSLNKLAYLYNSQGRYSEAEPLYQQALELRKKLLGEDHPSVASSLNNLAGLYDSQGRYSEAEPLYQQALELRKKLLGEDHPSVASSLNNLAYLYNSQGRYSEAEPLYQQAIAIAMNTLGENHPNTVTFIQNYQQMIFDFLMQLPEEELKERVPPEIYEEILRIRQQ
ncbi:MAG: tetratricopeptide repeat protein [Xenococcaceae cyanobacterium]